MGQEEILGIVRHVLTVGAGALVTDGILTGGDAKDGVGAIMVLIGIGWSIWQKRQQRKALAAASAPQAAAAAKP